MARLDDLMEFARLHGLKIGTIRDLIAYRLKKDHMVERVAETRFTSAGGGAWTAQVFRDKASGEEQLRWSTAISTRQADAGPHAFDRPVRRRAGRGESARRTAARCDGMIEAEGAGVIVALHAAAPGSLSLATNLASAFGRERAGAPGLRHRRADPGAGYLRHDPAVEHAPYAGRPQRLWAGNRRGAHQGYGEIAWRIPDRRGAILRASERHATGGRAGRDRGGGAQP